MSGHENKHNKVETCARTRVCVCVTHRWMLSMDVHYGTAGSVVTESLEVEAQI